MILPFGLTGAALEIEILKTLERNLKDRTGSAPIRLAESIRYSLGAPGKRIRPRLALACSEMLGVTQEAALCAGIALEMLHCFTLIHDDLPCMDDDDFRRGRPSNHKKFDEATALLAGDALVGLAYDSLLEAEKHVRPTALIQATKRLTSVLGPRGVVGGQSAETALEATSRLSELTQVHRQKTGALFSASVLIPADFAEIEGAQASVLARFAESLGAAFQIVDDLDDLEDSPSSILHYLSRSESERFAFEPLSQSVKELNEKWGKASQNLSEIANEVLGKLQVQK